jgi:hypothetical protein
MFHQLGRKTKRSIMVLYLGQHRLHGTGSNALVLVQMVMNDRSVAIGFELSFQKTFDGQTRLSPSGK